MGALRMLDFDGMKDEYLLRRMKGLINKPCVSCVSVNLCRHECVKEAMEIKYELVLRGDFEIISEVYEIWHNESSSLVQIIEDVICTGIEL